MYAPLTQYLSSVDQKDVAQIDLQEMAIANALDKSGNQDWEASADENKTPSDQ